MCGIAALLAPDREAATVRLSAMRDAVAHRGPDDEGLLLLDTCAGGRGVVGLAHRRLSILDLSDTGHQPLQYGDRYWVIHNGEIYNFLELRAALERMGHAFRSTSDTEVVLAAYAEWGPDCFRGFRGMWGMVLHDTQTGEVIVSRDRLGIKPLYYWTGHGITAVVSELKQLLSLPEFSARLDSEMAAEYLRTGHELADRTFFRDVRAVPPGHWGRITADGAARFTSYWDPGAIVPAITDEREGVVRFGEALRGSVRMHLRSDVPVGSALSGGLDSSAIVALAAEELGAGSIQTFTASFPGHPVDERQYVEAVTAAVGARARFVTPTPEGFLEDLPQFVWTHDEPIGSLSVYSSYCVARLTRQAGVPVILNGQGGDEILAGYWQSYLLYFRSLARRGSVFRLARHVAGAGLPGGNADLLRQFGPLLRRFRSHAANPVRLRLDVTTERPASPRDEILALDLQEQRVHQVRRLFLPRLLKWDDRNSMAFGVEGRYPFLDDVLIEVALSLSPDLLYRRGWTKWPLRASMAGKLPEVIRRRRDKIGFEVPQQAWLRGQLRETLESWLKSDRPIWDAVERDDVVALARRAWSSEAAGPEPGEALFRLFAFDQWLARFGVAQA